MGNCLICKTEISDGKEYCDKCLQGKENENYLDNLLNSVVTNAPVQNVKTQKKEKISSDKPELLNSDINIINSDIINEDDSYDISSDVSAFSDYDILNEISNDEEFDFRVNKIDDISDENERLENIENLSSVDSDENVEILDENISEYKNEELFNITESDNNQDEMENILDFLDNTFEENISESQTDNNDDNNIVPEIEKDEAEEDEMGLGTDDDILSFLNSMDGESEKEVRSEEKQSQSSEIDNSLFELDDLLGSLGMDFEDNGNGNEGGKTTSKTGGIEDIFSDSLGAVDFLNDNEEEKITNVESKVEEKKKKKNSNSFWSKIFGNIKEEITEEDISKARKEAAFIKEQEEAKKAKKAEKKAKKDKKEEASAEEGEEKSVEKKKKKTPEEKAAEKALKKASKKEKSKTEEDEIIEELNEGKINPIGAGIIIVFFAACTISIIIFTNTFSYSLSIENANKYYELKKYTQSYEELNGLKIKKRDAELYEKLRTIMYVNKEIESYNNYMFAKDYPLALDALFKGLKKYDKYIESANNIGVKEDLDYIKKDILTKMKENFNISEKEAKEIKNIEDSNAYSETVYDIIAKSNIEILKGQDEE